VPSLGAARFFSPREFSRAQQVRDMPTANLHVRVNLVKEFLRHIGALAMEYLRDPDPHGRPFLVEEVRGVVERSG